MGADSEVILNPGSGGASIASDLVTGKQYQVIKIATGGSGVADEVTTASPMPVTVITSVLPTNAATAANQQTDALTDAELRANPVPVNGTVNIGNFPATQPVSGTIAVSNFPATQPISAASLPLPTGAATAANQQTDALTNTQLRASAVPVSGTFFQATQPVSIAATVAVKEVRATTPTTTSPAVTNSNTSILASNSNRLGATIYNEGAAICYMILGSTATTTSYTLQIQVGGYYEVPFGYTGAIFGITSAGTAQLRVTEIS